MKLTPMASSRTSASPGPGTGSATDSSVSTSGPPCWWTRMAFMTPSCRACGKVASGTALRHMATGVRARHVSRMPITYRLRLLAALLVLAAPSTVHAQARPQGTRAVQAPDPRRAPTAKPPLHAKHWMAITGKPLGATAGAMIFAKGGNAVDAAAAMLAATCTMWDTLSCGGETQALIYDPRQKKVIGINALGVAPTGATAAFYKSKGHTYPPEYGPLAAVTPGTPGGLLVMLAEYGTLSLGEVLAPAIQMADGYPIEAQTANAIERGKARLKGWKYSREVMLPHLGQTREAPEPGEIFVQRDLAATLRRRVEA